MRYRQCLTLLVVVSLAGCKVGADSSGSSSGEASRGPAPSTTRTGVGTGGFAVTDLVVRADPFQVTTTCPTTITFSGRISVTGVPGSVVYRWVRSDGTQGPMQTIKFDRASKQDVATTWTLGAPGTNYSGWQTIEIIRPKDQTSERASFTLTCR
jgi:hypothetical protein